MSRPERPLDPAGGVVHEFAAVLRRLRVEAGRPVYRQMARQAHYSSTTLSEAAGGRQLPSLAVTLAYVEVCGGEPAEWEARWRAAKARLSTVDQRAPGASGAPVTPPRAAARRGQAGIRRRQTDLALVCLSAGAVLAAVVTATVRRPRTRQAGYGGALRSDPAD